ncbi:MAG TPA: hypothetical protein VLC08_16270 [Chitinolyticbacter sp.]|nr:hypothetical protein [Chitinolyticbacter sp.]
MNKETKNPAKLSGVLSIFVVLCLTGWIGFFAIGFGFVVPAFAELFSSFGSGLPPLTEFVLETPTPLWRLLLLGFLVQLGLFVFLLAAKTFTARRFAFISSGINIALHLLLIVALYLPVFNLGTTV